MTLSRFVECDETYDEAGHKGQSAKVGEARRSPLRRRLKGSRGGGTKATEKPPVLGMIQRSGEAVIRLLYNIQQKTIQPLTLQTVAAKTPMSTDEYTIYGKLTGWGYEHKTINHSKGEYAHDEDGDGFHLS